MADRYRRARFDDRVGGEDGTWEHDGEGWLFEGEAPGPAGMVSVEVPAGIIVDFDVADLTTITGVWAPGSGDLDQVASDVEQTLIDRRLLAWLAMAEDVLAGALQPSDATLALAAVDRAIATIDLAHLFDRGERTRRIRSAIEGVHDNVEDLLEVDRPELIAGALRMLGRSLDHPDAGGTLDALAAAFDEARHERNGLFADALDLEVSAMAAPSMAVPREEAAGTPVSRLLDIVDLDVLPEGLHATQVAARHTSPSEIEVRVGVPVAAGAWWARAHRADGLVVAAAPLRPSGASAVARLLVPPADVKHVVIDLTNRPGDPRQGEGLRGVVRAVRTGRIAARDERAWRATEAEQGWRRTAEAWEAVGDKRRAVAALDRVKPSRFGTQVDSLLSDLPEL